MTKITEQQLWVVAHLLYPNSSQAIDVYYTILSMVSKKNNLDYSKKIYRKLAQFFIKTAAVRSSQPFQVFENNKLENWNQLYKRSPKIQLLVICGLIVFKFSIQELAKILELPEQKVKFLINQSFKKTSQLSIVKPSVTSHFEYKKKSEDKISYLYTNENLVEYSLGLLKPVENIRVEQGLSIYKQLVPLNSFYKEIIDELNTLAADTQNHYFQSESQSQNQKIVHIEPIRFDTFKIQKKYIGFAAVSILFILVVSLRPAWLQNLSFKSGSNNSLVMQEIKSQPYLTEKDAVALAQDNKVNLHEMPVDAKPEISTTENEKSNDLKESKVAVVDHSESKSEKTEKKTAPAVAAITSPKIEDSINKKAEKTSSKKVSGLYRATISVSDLDSTSARITEKLVALGGKKAGEVELGWKKNQNLSYYHLTIPEENLEAAKSYLKNFGKLNIQFESHPRLLPAGVSRIILEVKESE